MSPVAESVECPAITIVVEGYNETKDLGIADNTMAALAAQDFPTEKMEVILVGNTEQAGYWQQAFAHLPFFRFRALAKDGARYFELKNAGAELATAPIIAFTDSDVQPRTTWVSAIVETIEQGADVSVGLSLFHKSEGWILSPDSPMMIVAATLTWGWVLGKRKKGSIPQARGFMDHNIAMRSSVFRTYCYRTDYGRILGSSFLFRQLVEGGFRVAVHPAQQAVHHFSWYYWLVGLHFRYGHEVYRLRRLNPNYPNRWISRTGIFEPVVTTLWHMMLDLPRWFRFISLLGKGPFYAIRLLPMLVAASAVVRSSEAAGIAATMLSPERVRRWAENV